MIEMSPPPAPVAQKIKALGYMSADPHIQDNLSLTFIYHPRHPYSVLIDISAVDPRDGSLSKPIRWEVGREILHDAAILGRPSGIGDFRATALGSRQVRLRLIDAQLPESDAEYSYVMFLSRRKLRTFVLRTTDAVPVGLESRHLDIDGQLERMFA